MYYTTNIFQSIFEICSVHQCTDPGVYVIVFPLQQLVHEGILIVWLLCFIIAHDGLSKKAECQTLVIHQWQQETHKGGKLRHLQIKN